MKTFFKGISIVLCFLLTHCAVVWAEPVEINGDNIEYSVDKKKVIVTGNVEIRQKNSVLMSDYAEYIKADNTAYARGHVVINEPGRKIETEEVTYDFKTESVVTPFTKFYVPPMYASAQSVTTTEEGGYRAKTARMTMSDYDDPEYYFAASSLTVDEAKTKMVGRNIRLKIDDIPIFYLPFYVKHLENTHTPGHHQFGRKSQTGFYSFNRWDYELNRYLQGSLYLDYRELQGFSEGADIHYNTPESGSGVIRTSYMNEDSKTGVTRERYFNEWRHDYHPNEKTQVLTQMSNLSDDGYLSNYFHKYDGDPIPPSYIAATHHLDYGSLSGVVTPRLSPFTSQTEYLPQVRYDLPDVPVADTGLYWRNTTEAAYMDHREGGVAHDDKNNARGDFDQELSYPFDVAFLQVTPFVGSEHTYYQETLDPSEDQIVRNSGRAGTSFSTKFFKTYNDVHMKIFGEKFDGLRHIITPEIKYETVGHPTIDKDNLYPFDDIDRRNSSHAVYFTLQNALQTKRHAKPKTEEDSFRGDNGSYGLEPYELSEYYGDFYEDATYVQEDQTVNLFRIIVGTAYNLDKTNGLNHGFQTIDLSMSFTPLDWMMASASSTYDPGRGTFTAFNSDFTVRKGNWSLGTGYSYNISSDDLLTTSLAYHPNRKWDFRLYERFDLQEGYVQEQEYAIVRDFHAWALYFLYNKSDDNGEELRFVFKFKEVGSVIHEEHEEDEDEENRKYYPRQVGVIEKDDIY